MTRKLLWTNHVLITLFAISSGIFKVLQGPPDIELFSHIGMTPLMVMAFGAMQAAGGVGLIFSKTCRPAAIVVALCNTLATAGTFVAGLIPFGVVSILFIVMALLELKLGRDAKLAKPV